MAIVRANFIGQRSCTRIVTFRNLVTQRPRKHDFYSNLERDAHSHDTVHTARRMAYQAFGNERKLCLKRCLYNAR